MRALIAEDDPTSRRLLELLLRKWGHEVTCARDGEEAWAVLSSGHAPRVAILDWMMPGIDGLELCRRARESRGLDFTYIIMLTARTRTEDVVGALEAGADDYVTKPFDHSELKARLRVAERVIGLQDALARRVTELQGALDHVKRLQGIVPICMHCHKIRTDQDAWDRLEAYIEAHSDAQFSHSLCPECLEKYYPETASGEDP
jgi:phosphoserine phosphatase RsbU/P